MNTPFRRASPIALGLAVATDAHASYSDGALGVFLLLIAVPVGVLLLVLAFVMRAADAFDDADLRRKCRLSSGMLALVPVLLAGTGDPASSLLVLVAAAVFMLAIFAATRPWPGRAGSGRSGEDNGDGDGEGVPPEPGPQ